TREALTSRVAHESTTWRAELANVRDRVDPALTGVDDLVRRVDAIDDRFATPLTDPPPPPAATGAAPGADRGELDTLGSQLTRLEERITAVDRRVTAVSTELANQLSELGSDIEELTRARTSGEGPADVGDAPVTGGETGTTVDTGMLEELFDELHDAQQRLASEQARYQIAFREDLARLAEDLRRRANR
ncbi:MAG: hypothetical protein WD225_00310, partial [Ilumatobacteraceae bacterium]